MQVLLINPPETHMITTNVPEFVDVETGKYPPLGLLHVAAAILEHYQRHSVDILDCHAEDLDYEGIEKKVSSLKPDIIGIQATTFTLIDVAELARICKRVHPRVPMAVGGPHTWLYPEETLEIEAVDYVLLGEGEQNFPLFLDALEDNTDLSDIKGLVYKEDEKIVRTPLPGLIDNLDALPLPPRELLPYKKYYSVLARRTPITTMMSSRGCPYRCLFCNRPHLGKKWRYRSPESIVAELEACVKLGIHEIFFYDDTFNISGERVLDLCDLIRQRNLDISWDVRARIDRMTPELIHAMARAGCARIHYGVEAGTPEMVEVLRKDVDLDEAKDIFAATRRAGITTLAYFMIGNPGETMEHIERTIEYALELKSDFVHFSVTTPFPGTDLYQMALDRGIIKNDIWREFARDPRPDFSPPLWEEHLSREQLVEILTTAYKKYYLRPGYIANQLKQVRSFSEFTRKARAGLNMLLHKSSK